MELTNKSTHGNPKILLVDDKDENLLILEKMLAPLKVQTIQARSGKAAIELTSKHNFVLAIIDVAVADMSDFEKVCQFRQEENIKYLPLIFLSSNLDQEYYKIEGVAQGSVAFISKPITPQIIQGKINIFLNLYKQKQSILKHAQFQADFLAKMSHEIRTPMNSILGMTDLLIASPLEHEQREWLKVIRSSGTNLLSVIDDILDISKLESGHLKLKERDFDIMAYLEEAIEPFKVLAQQHQNQIILKISETIPKIIIGDPVRIWQVLTNLIGNAMKFTHNGTITVTCENKTNWLTFTVADSGCGMDETMTAHLFDRYADHLLSESTNSGGTGLGMQISKDLIELMNGTIKVESSLGIGTKFTLTIPLKTPKHHLKTIKTILIVDDEPEAIALHTEILKADYQLLIATNGKEALDIIKSNKVDTIISDIEMPVMNGVELANTIYCQRIDTPIIFVTAHRNEEVNQLISKFESIDLLEKPIDEILIRKKLSQIENRGDRTQLKELEDLPALKILLVDDSKENIALINAYFRKTPFTLDTALNGLEAITKFENNKFDLILMDTNMPIMDGNSATKRIREIEIESKIPRTPIMALTAYATEDEKQISLKAGHDAYLTKPIKKNDLIKKIIRLST